MTYQLGVKRYLGKTENAHGDIAEIYADPTPWEVRGVAPGAQSEPGDVSRDLSIVAWTVYADPSEQAPKERDRVVVDGEEFDVNGRPDDWSRFAEFPDDWFGIVVELRRVDG